MKVAWLPAMIAAMALAAGCASSTTSDKMSLEEGAQVECRSVERSGTILPKRVCNNKATWAAIEERNKEQAAAFDSAVNDRYMPIPPREVSLPTRPRQ